MTDESIRLQEQEDALFAEWKASPDFPKDGKFIRDGIIADMDQPVICLLLKEWPRHQNNDLRRHIYVDGAKRNTYDNAAMWAFMLRHKLRSNEDVEYSRAAKQANSHGRKYNLSRCLVVNCNKRGNERDDNSSESDEDSMLDNFRKRDFDRELLRKQIKLYSPRIIVCCGDKVVECLCAAFNMKKPHCDFYEYTIQKGKKRRTKVRIKYYWYEHTLVVDFMHPNQRTYYQEDLFNLLNGCVDKALQNEPI